MKWTIHRWKCRHGYRDGCRPVWMASPPDDHPDLWMSLEFDTWTEAIRFVNKQIVSA